MMDTRYVRAGVAFFAALGLHALVFMALQGVYTSEKHSAHLQTIQVSILAEQPSDPVEEKVAEQSVRKQQVSEASQATSATPLPEKLAANQTKKDSQQVKKDANQNQKPVVVAQHIQSLILAKVSYPRRALRRGWQGETKLQFHINQQVIQRIHIQRSSGYSVLDQAAFKALASVQTLPLSDGNYFFPVIFKLQ